jgi:hypothetical protein
MGDDSADSWLSTDRACFVVPWDLRFFSSSGAPGHSGRALETTLIHTWSLIRTFLTELRIFFMVSLFIPFYEKWNRELINFLSGILLRKKKVWEYEIMSQKPIRKSFPRDLSLVIISTKVLFNEIARCNPLSFLIF